MRYWLIFTFAAICFSSATVAQEPAKPNSTEIYHSLQKLNFLGSALYIAAHPDDENTRLISYLSNQVKARTAYLSITRGDGGQNLIGPELRELLGVLRTQELLAARRVDGGEQYFTRANDFGYSKHPRETLKVWDKEEVLSDVVWVIRNFKPDIIVNRFNHRTAGTTHGHHTSSALLSMEAFDLAGESSAYTTQLGKVAPWKPSRLFFNTSWWFYGSRENFEKADKTNLLSVDIGVYYPMLGKSNNEIASIASSQHRCQGFGRLTTRGSTEEYLELLKGDMPSDENLFEGIDTSWSRIENGSAIGDILNKIEDEFNFRDPASHLPELLRAHNLLVQNPDKHWRQIKLPQLEAIIQAVSGLYLEASATSAHACPGESIALSIEAINRSDTKIRLKSYSATGSPSIQLDSMLRNNKKYEARTSLMIPEEAPYTSPYWLTESGTKGMYSVSDPSLIGSPETPRQYFVEFSLDFNGYGISFSKPVVYRYSRPDKGEIYQPFEILPPVSAEFSDKVLVFPDNTPRKIGVRIKALADNAKGSVSLRTENDWKVAEDFIPFRMEKKGEERTLEFMLLPPSTTNESRIEPVVSLESGKEYSSELVKIEYDHIPTQNVLLPSSAKVVRLDLEKRGQHIGYIQGAGDEVPTSLEQIGYVVHEVKPDEIDAGSLDKFDAVVVGIRAYNVVPELKFKQQQLFDYVAGGGNLIIQYNTAGRWDAPYEDIAPYPLKLSRTRVAEEDSPVKIITPDHPLVNYPNKITEKDFENWVQERGLYFPNSWSKKFTPVFSMSDNGEAPAEGSLLVAPHGKGHYIYTGLSFFRELPAGVSGAFRIFANMLSIGKNEVPNEPEIKG